MGKWLFQNFLTFSDRALYIAYAVAIALWIMPVTEAQAVFAFDWALLVLLRNFLAVLIVVGGLHFWFYGIDG